MMTPSKAQAIIADWLWDSTRSIADVAATNRCTTAYVYQCLRHVGYVQPRHRPEHKPTATRPVSNHQAIIAEYISSPGVTLETVGRSHGITRERVRQILARAGVSTKRSKVYNPPYFSVRLINSWLREIGAKMCSTCRAANAPVTGYECRQCNTKRCKAYYHTPDGREAHQRAKSNYKAKLALDTQAKIMA